MRKKILVLTVIIVGIFCSFSCCLMAAADELSNPLVLFVGSATKPATEEAVRLFENRYNTKVELHFGGSGAMLTQMIITGGGDLYFPGSSDFMEKAKRMGAVISETERQVVYLIPAINVQRNNVKNIKTLNDLTMPNVKIAIAKPNTVCVGLYAVEVIEKAGLSDKIKPNIVTYAESCSKTAMLIALGSVDAIIGWRVFQYWSPETIQTIFLNPEELHRIGYVPIAISRNCKNTELAKKFIDFITSEDGQAIYNKWHYITKIEDARKFASPLAAVGGEWRLPESWR